MNVSDFIINDKEQVTLNDVLLSHDNKTKIEQLIKEHFYIEELHKFGLPVNNKLLLHGSSGCGKTTTAKAIAKALNKPLLILDLSNIVSARIGETSQNIKQVFDKAIREKAVLFLDEFDQVGKARGNDDKDVGEMRRLVNTLIQLIDYYPERALLIGATNHAQIIDKALLRRFQLHIAYEMPSATELDKYYDKLLNKFPDDMQAIKRRYNISYAEAKDDAYTQIKATVLRNLENKLPEKSQLVAE
ncbi:AAA family ATPase [Chitinophaga sp. CF418]|uniref:AAA family ATPase n=1 Tax=Chitinophaga sp. CF418 TaxID=1855287 RepID=UPI000912BB1E|nr:ATP-binding protein [Chitinophaga sp. CF418]SHN42424.1 ATPase family associated with various cellular activities (AAA) [Chitinophaga sp. CF418]